jgi:hypothetical protein
LPDLGQLAWRYERECFLTPYGREGRRLGAEFLGATLDLIVWDQVDNEGARRPAIMRRSDSYRSIHKLPEAPAVKRIRDIGDGRVELVSDQALSVYDLNSESVVAKLRAERSDPFHADAIYPHRPVIAVGTFDGLVVAWDRQSDRELFRRRYFPREQMAWITDLAIDPLRDVMWIAWGGQVFAVSANSGDPIPNLVVEIGQEVGAIAYATALGVLAVGGLMRTHLLRTDGVSVEPLDTFETPGRWFKTSSFSSDGCVLAVHAGGIGPSAIALYATQSLAALGDPIGDEYGEHDSFTSMKTAARFARDSSALAIGQGDCIGLYLRRGTRPVRPSPTRSRESEPLGPRL